jgi:hypothetical protein
MRRMSNTPAASSDRRFWTGAPVCFEVAVIDARCLTILGRRALRIGRPAPESCACSAWTGRF